MFSKLNETKNLDGFIAFRIEMCNTVQTFPHKLE